MQAISPSESALDQFEAAYAGGREPRIEDFVPAGPDAGPLLCELVRIDLSWRWRRGGTARLEDYLARFPALAADRAALNEVAFEDYRQRWLHGDPVPANDYQLRFGVDTTGWGPLPGGEATAVRPMPASPLHTPTRVVGSGGPPEGPASVWYSATPGSPSLPLPQPGERFLGFELLEELGRGAFGRVYLARQAGLAGRLVAVKVSADLWEESHHLAQLQHTHIVPIYSHHRSGRFHAVCMPYFGCTTLADVCRGLRPGDRLPTSGRFVLSTMRQRLSTVRGPGSDQGPASVREAAAPEAPPAEGFRLEPMPYVDAVLWIGARLAEGLQHAHDRGILHLDLKPANVLLTDDGRPMLLDFNLAEDTKERAAARAHVGGTLPYMSPEQLRAFSHGDLRLDGRADVYALGLILYHLLTGRPAFRGHTGSLREVLPVMLSERLAGPPSVREHNRAVSPAVDAIVRRCLEPDREKRYPTAAALAEDIEAHRADLPLKHTPEPSLLERAAKWMRRHPRLTSPVTVAALTAAVGLGVLLVAAEQRLEGRRQAAQALYARFEDRSREAHRLLIDDDPGRVEAGAREGLEALALYAAVDAPRWHEHHPVRLLPPERQAALRRDVGELAFLLARAALLDPNRKLDLPVERLQGLADAQLGDGGRAALAALREDLAGRDGGAAAAGKGGSPFLLACQHVAAGRCEAALALLGPLVEATPGSFGGWYLKGRCHVTLGQPADAMECFSKCIVLQPDAAQAYLARAGVAHAHLANLPQAKADLDRALKLRPNYLDARIERGLVLLKMRRPKDALKDLDRALESDSCPTRVWIIRSLAREQLGDKAGARADRAEGLRRRPADATSYVARGVAKLRQKDQEGALADFRKAEEIDPRHLEAMNNQAYVLGELQKKHREALAVLDRLLRVYPDYVNGRGGRAVLLARLGRAGEAVAEARRCLKLSTHPENLYRVACIFALTADGAPERLTEARKLLASALLQGWGHQHLAADTDLDALRSREDFRKLVEAVSLLNAWKGGRP